MPLSSQISSRDALNVLTSTEERRRTGRYVAGGTALAVTLLLLHHVLLRGASTVAGVCIPAIIMASYIIWVLYSARRDRRKAIRLATAMQLAEVTSESGALNGVVSKGLPEDDRKESPAKNAKQRSGQECQDNPAFSEKDLA